MGGLVCSSRAAIFSAWLSRVASGLQRDRVDRFPCAGRPPPSLCVLASLRERQPASFQRFGKKACFSLSSPLWQLAAAS